jgi:hypothetical protein
MVHTLLIIYSAVMQVMMYVETFKTDYCFIGNISVLDVTLTNDFPVLTMCTGPPAQDQ